MREGGTLHFEPLLSLINIGEIYLILIRGFKIVASNLSPIIQFQKGVILFIIIYNLLSNPVRSPMIKIKWFLKAKKLFIQMQFYQT